MRSLFPTLRVLTPFLAACGGGGVTGDPDFSGSPLPDGSQVEITLGGTTYVSGNPNVQMSLQPHSIPEDSLIIGAAIFNTPHGQCGMSILIASDIGLGTHTSGNMNGFIGGGIGCTELGDPIGPGLTGTLTLEQADGRFLRGSFDLVQAFKDGTPPLAATGQFVLPYPRR